LPPKFKWKCGKKIPKKFQKNFWFFFLA
jgi:hypothetical protein